MIVLQTIFSLIVHASLASAVMVLLLLIIRGMFDKRLAPKFIYLMWVLVLIKLLIPIAPSSSVSFFNLVPQSIADKWIIGHSNLADLTGPMKNEEINRPPAPVALESNGGEIQGEIPSRDSSVNRLEGHGSVHRTAHARTGEVKSDWSNLLTIGLFIWLGGLLLLGIYYIRVRLLFRKRVRLSRLIHNKEVLSVLKACSEKLGIKHTIPVYAIGNFHSPYIHGRIKPNIYLPDDIIVIADSRQLTHILLHELAHYKRKDLWLNSFWTFAVWLHWFNPLVWLARKKMIADREMACDAAVLEALGEKESSSYGLTLLMLSRLSSRSLSPPIHLSYFFNNKNETKRRITMIAKFKEGSSKLSVAAILSIFMLGAVLLTNANVESNAAKSIEASKENTVSSFQIDRLIPSYKWFNNLDRALAFAKFDFKVPDDLPQGYRLENIDLGENFSKANKADLVEYVSLTFVSNFGQQNERNMEVYAARGSGTLLEHQLLWGAAHSQEQGRALSYRQEDVTFGDRQGVVYTSSKAKYKQKPETAQSFVWQENGITYAINYYSKDLEQEELAKVVQSAVWPDKVQHVDYKGGGNSFPLYDEADLHEAKSILGFPVKFPFDLSNYGFRLSDSTLLQADDQNTGFYIRPYEDALWHSYRVPSDSSIYEINDEINFYQSKKPVVDANKLSFLRKLEINDIEISAYSDNNHTYWKPIPSDNHKSRFKSQTYYIWEQNGFYYTAFFLGVDKHQEENLEALVLAPAQ